jgi:CHAD domain-containing protein
LKEGKRVDLIRLGRRVARNVGAEYGLWAKAERGYALKAGLQGQPTFAAPITIDASMSAEEAFRTIGFSCLRHCDGNREAVTRGEAEGLHQMRVALRRLHVAMAVFQGKAASASALGREVKWLIAQLTPARDFDVFLHEHLIPRCKAEPNCVGLQMLLKAARQRRRSEFAKVQALVTGSRYRKFVLEAVLFLSSDPPKTDKAHELQEVASACFEHLVHGIRRRLKEFDRLDVKEKHKLRIMAKKMRYAADFFEPLYSGKRNGARLKRFKKAVKDLQDILGTLNDIAVHQKLIQTLLLEPGWNRQRQEVFELGVLSESERLQARDIKKTARQAGKALAHAPCFWET